jgi:hypothetical protein
LSFCSLVVAQFVGCITTNEGSTNADPLIPAAARKIWRALSVAVPSPSVEIDLRGQA